MKLSESQALHRLAAYCSKAERCESDIWRKMLAWELADEEKSRIVSRLKQEKFLDDRRFATAFVNDKSRFSKWGKVKIEFELRKKKIDETLIREATSTLDDAESEAVLGALLLKKEASIKAKNDYDKRAKLLRFALGRGYSMGVALRCIDKISKLNDEYLD